MSADRLAGIIKNPQLLNRYTYVGNDPANFVDPMGLLQVCSGWWGGPEGPGPVEGGHFTGCEPVNFPEPSPSGDDRPAGNKGGTKPKPQPQTDCDKLVQKIQEIANRTTNEQDFLDEVARYFTAAGDSSISEMRRTQNRAPRNRFGDTGFKQEFRDGSNQVRHFVGGLIAGYHAGALIANLFMNSRETPGVDDPDIALNAVSTWLGASQITPNPELGISGYKGLGDQIRDLVCDKKKP